MKFHAQKSITYSIVSKLEQYFLETYEGKEIVNNEYNTVYLSITLKNK